MAISGILIEKPTIMTTVIHAATIYFQGFKSVRNGYRVKIA